MNGNYTITTLTFDGTAGSFTLGSSGGYGLTLTGGSIANNSANAQTLNLAITNGGNLVDVSGGDNVVFNSGIAGAGGLQDDNSGKLILNGTNSFTGGININSGTLQIAGAGLLGGTNGNYAGNITNFGAFQYSSSATQTLAGVISFLGPIKDGSGRLILTANNTYTGNTVISNGVLQIAGAGGLGYGSAGVGSTVDYYIGNLLVNGTFEYSSSYGQTIVNAITGTGGVVVDGLGTLILNGANTYSGPTVVTGGTLVYSPNTFTYPTINSLSIYSNAIVTVNANNGASLPVGNLTLNSNSILNLNYDFSGGNPTVAAVAVSGSLSAPGTNIVLRITGFGAALGQFPLISYTGASPANLNNYIPSLPPGVTATLVNNTGAKTIDLNITASSPTTWIPMIANDGLGMSSITNSVNWQDGNVPTAGNGYYTRNFLLRSPADTNNYTFAGSALSIDQYVNTTGGRFLMKGSGGATITITNLILNGGLVDYADPVTGNETLAGMITLNGGTTSYLGAYAASSLSVTAPISGTGNLQIGGANVNAGADTGFVALSGASTYTGSTTVAGGTLLANGTAPSTSVTVLTNGTLGGLGSIGGTATVQVGGKLAPGIVAQGALTNTIGTLTVGGAVSASGTVAMKINRGVSPNADELVAPSLTINSGATLTVANIGSTNLVAGDTFTLFSTPVSGAFTTVTLPTLPGTNVFWTNNLAVNGTIGVVASSVPASSTNAYLASLVLTPAGTLSPAFTTNGFAYNATNTYLNNPVTVTATSADTNATLALSFNGGGYGAKVTNSLSVAGNILVLPMNTVAIQVVSQDLSQTNIYTVNVVLQPSQTVPLLTNSVSGSGTTLSLSWPADHLGYRLLQQTNNLNKGVSGNPNDWGTVAGSTSVTATNITIIKATNNAYYRLVYP